MSVVLSVVIMLIILGVLITVHEWGHFIAARLCGINVREFAIGMGPKFYTHRKKNAAGEPTGTMFSLRVLPIGGFCDMGEDEDSDDPTHFRNKKLWQKLIVLVSGALMNFIVGFLILLVMYLTTIGMQMRAPVITSLMESASYSNQIQPGDRIHKINGQRVYSYQDALLFFERGDGKPITMELIRGNERLTVTGVERNVPGINADGEEQLYYGFILTSYDDITPFYAIRQAAYSSIDYVRLVWMSLGDLISGRAGAQDLMGPVGMGSEVNKIVTTEEASIMDRLREILNLAGLIAVNLAIVNLLPIPALDGGRIIFLFVSAILVIVRKRPLSSKIEGYIHGVTMLLLFGLMFFVLFNDIRRLVGW